MFYFELILPLNWLNTWGCVCFLLKETKSNQIKQFLMLLCVTPTAVTPMSLLLVFTACYQGITYVLTDQSELSIPQSHVIHRFIINICQDLIWYITLLSFYSEEKRIFGNFGEIVKNCIYELLRLYLLEIRLLWIQPQALRVSLMLHEILQNDVERRNSHWRDSHFFLKISSEIYADFTRKEKYNGWRFCNRSASP